MRKGRTAIKAELMKEAEKVMDELLEWTEETKKPNLSQIEGVVLELRKRLSEKMVEELVKGQEAIQPVPGPKCESCGQEMRYKGKLSKEVRSWVGDIKLERGYYHCSSCKKGLFPPG